MSDSQSVRVLHLITGLETGGAEMALFNLLRGGLSQSHENKVVSLRDEGTIGPRIRSLGVSLSALQIKSPMSSFRGLQRLLREIRAFRPDIIQGWMYHGNLAASLASRFSQSKAKLIWNIRQSLYALSHEKLLTQQVIRANRRYSDEPVRIIYNSSLARQQHEAFGFVAARGVIVPNGFDIERFRPSITTGMAMRRELGIAPSDFVVGHVARLHPVKNHRGFIDAAIPLGRRFENLRFVMIGRGVTADNPELLGAVPPDMRARFHLLGARTDIPDLMCAMDTLCQSSWGEGFPNVLGEAMSTGVPCIATNVGDSARVIGDTGIIAGTGGAEELTDGLERMHAMSEERRTLLGKRARQRIESHFSIQSAVDQYRALYCEALAPAMGS